MLSGKYAGRDDADQSITFISSVILANDSFWLMGAALRMYYCSKNRYREREKIFSDKAMV